MQKEWITVRTRANTLNCDIVILVGAMAAKEDGHITMLSRNSGPQAKHAFHALAQVVLIQYQDKELAVSGAEDPILVEWDKTVNEIASGMAICRTSTGDVWVLAHRELPWRKLLDAAYRYCTRWIRLDVR
jgi:hypothetical protein